MLKYLACAQNHGANSYYRIPRYCTLWVFWTLRITAAAGSEQSISGGDHCQPPHAAKTCHCFMKGSKTEPLSQYTSRNTKVPKWTGHPCANMEFNNGILKEDGGPKRAPFTRHVNWRSMSNKGFANLARAGRTQRLQVPSECIHQAQSKNMGSLIMPMYTAFSTWTS